MCPVSQYPETHQLLKDNLQNLLDNILGVLEEGDKLNDVDALKKKNLVKSGYKTSEKCERGV